MQTTALRQFFRPAGFLLLFLLTAPEVAQSLHLSWQPAPDNDVSHYIVYRDTLPGSMMPYTTIPFGETTFSDSNIMENRTYYYKLTAVDHTGNESMATAEVSGRTGGLTSVNDPKTVTKTFELAQNYPNPFNPGTTISYRLIAEDRVRLHIFDALGRRIKTLADEIQDKGSYSIEWNGNNNDGYPQPSGIYFYQLEVGHFRQTRKAILQK